ncbi:MAG: hypothetical protein ACXWRE_04495 [Pseudobdellovibrionaceae bacterium]
MKYPWLLPLVLFGLIACKTLEIQDGKVPDEYLSQIKKIEGVYHGTFASNASQIEIRFQGSVPQIIYTDDYGHEILDEGCHSQIGHLTELTISNEDNPIADSRAVFAFNPGSCTDIKGREFILKFKSEKNFSVEILKEMHYTNSCHRGGCRTITTPFKLEGSFSR